MIPRVVINGKEWTKEDILNSSSFSTDFEQHVILFLRDWLLMKNEFVFHTSGSTGVPKAITFSREQLEASARVTAQYFNFQKGWNALLCLHPQYVAAKMMLVRCMVMGMNIIAVEPSRNPWKHIEEPIHVASFVPVQIPQHISGDWVEKASSLQVVLLGGAHVSQSLSIFLKHTNARVYETFGMTETLTHFAVKDLRKNSPCFDVLPPFHISTNDESCLQVHAPHLGVTVKSTDVIQLINAQQFVWKGRNDFVINSGGIKIFPEEAEKHILDIQQLLGLSFPVLVHGVPHAEWGSAVEWIVESTTTDDDVQRVAEQVSSLEKPKSIKKVQQFFYTNSGKIDRKRMIQV